MKIEPIGYVNECEDYTMSIIKATRWEHYCPVAVYTEAQMRQLGEACAEICESEYDNWDNERPLRICATAIRELIKEMLP